MAICKYMYMYMHNYIGGKCEESKAVHLGPGCLHGFISELTLFRDGLYERLNCTFKRLAYWGILQSLVVSGIQKKGDWKRPPTPYVKGLTSGEALRVISCARK